MKWKVIPGFDDYKVSNTGRVWSDIKQRELKPWNHQNGYLIVDLTKDGKRYHRRLHRVVLLAFIGKPPIGKTDVNHKDGNKHNNNLNNLEYCSRSYNLKHRHHVLKMRAPRGKREHPLTDSEIDAIRKMHQSKKYALKEIREYWNISHGCLCCIIYKCGIYKNRGSV